MNVGMNQFDIIVKPHTRHNILVYLDHVKHDRHQNIHFLFYRNRIELRQKPPHRVLTDDGLQNIDILRYRDGETAHHEDEKGDNQHNKRCEKRNNRR